MTAGERLLVPFDLVLKDRLYAVMLKSFYYTSKLLDDQYNDHSKDSLIKISLGGLAHRFETQHFAEY